jgi:predicted GTPase
LLLGASGSGKSSLINYLAGAPLAPVGDYGSSCTMDFKSYEVILENRKLRIFDTQGFNDTTGKTNTTVASTIKSLLMNENSTKQIDAVWILHGASNFRCYLDAIFSSFKELIGPEMRGMTTIIISQCDTAMESGDYNQYPKGALFNEPEDYNEEDEITRKDRFWVKIMQPYQPFKFAEE